MLMKKLLVLPMLFFSISCFADVYIGTFQFSNRSVSLKYTFDLSNKSNLKGTFEANRSGRMTPCWQGIRSIDGSKIAGADIVLIAAPNAAQEGMSCEVIEFVGKSEGNKLIGRLTFGPNVADVVLTKEK
jgi:hypothetical protein